MALLDVRNPMGDPFAPVFWAVEVHSKEYNRNQVGSGDREVMLASGETKFLYTK